LLEAVQKSRGEKKTLVITCDENSVPKNPGIEVKQVSEIGVIGLRQLAMAASTSISATIVYCLDGLCVSKEHVKRAVNLIAGITKVNPPFAYYLEGREGAGEIERIHNTSPTRESSFELAAGPWKSYVNAIEHISYERAPAAGLGFTDVRIAESCTLCNACVDRCPHKALGIEEGELIFNSRECTGCGYCEQICPEHSITLLARDGSIQFAERPVYRDEMVRCSKCDAPYASAKMLRKVTAALEANKVTPLCPRCKEEAIYEKLYGKPSPVLAS
jgi:ferredoxin